ncbi:MAG: DUF5658 family protein [Bacillota bacterium]
MKTRFDLKGLEYVLAVIALLNFADYFLTLRAISLGIREGNPYMAGLIETPWFAIVKLLVVPAGLYRIHTLRRGIGWISLALLALVLALYTFVTVYHVLSLVQIMM